MNNPLAPRRQSADGLEAPAAGGVELGSCVRGILTALGPGGEPAEGHLGRAANLDHAEREPLHARHAAGGRPLIRARVGGGRGDPTGLLAWGEA